MIEPHLAAVTVAPSVPCKTVAPAVGICPVETLAAKKRDPPGAIPFAQFAAARIPQLAELGDSIN